MNNTSKTILSILKLVFTLAFYLSYIILAVLIFISISKIFNINIGKLAEIRINVGKYSDNNTDLQSITTFDFTFIILIGIISMILYINLFKNVLKIIDSINVMNPFSEKVVSLLFKTHKILLILAIATIIFDFVISFINGVSKIEITFSSIQYLLFSGIVYVISQIYKQGVEIKKENDLTI